MFSDFKPRKDLSDKFKVPGFIQNRNNGAVILLTEYDEKNGLAKGMVIKAIVSNYLSPHSYSNVGNIIVWPAEQCDRIEGEWTLRLE